MKKPTLLILFWMLCQFTTDAQGGTDNQPAVSKKIPDIEKIYLHTDRAQYTLGEDLWYKAYVVYAYNHVLFDHSKLLYVELVSPESKIVSRHITKLNQGLGHGDFTLTDSLGVKPGRYQLRAYTNWNRNFGEDFVFEKEIEIVNLREETNKVGKGSKKKKTPEGRAYIDIKDVDVQFFPEGGSLVEDVISVVAFKATDGRGMPVDVQGAVMDGSGNQVALFRSSHKGMGKFSLKPQKGSRYTAEISNPNGGKPLKVGLPEADAHGYVLGYKKAKDKDVITISTNQATLAKTKGQLLTLVGAVRGVTYFKGSQELNHTRHSFVLPKAEFPEGIARLTLYDEAQRPYSERLVYVEKERNLDITLTTEKQYYSPKEKAVVKLNSKTDEGKPVLASYSMSVTEKSVSPDANAMSIASYFLMESDIRGKVHQSQYYFNPDNPKRLRDLDLLLLTQGWRDFLWKKIPESNNSFKIEKEIVISGNVKERSGKNIESKQIVRMVLTNRQGVFVDEQIVDSNGYFAFRDLAFTGLTSMMLNTQNIKDKTPRVIKLNPMNRAPIAASFTPSIKRPESMASTDQLKTHILKKYSDFNYQDLNLLDEVLIEGKAKKEERNNIGSVDYAYELDDKTPRPSSMLILLQFHVPGLIATGNSVRFSRFQGPPLIMLDGAQVDMSLLSDLNTDDISKIESITSSKGSVYGSQGANGVIFIYTKLGSVGPKKKNRKPSTITKKIQGYYNARVFYSPNYDALEEKPEDPDIRNTLYWNPYVHPDKNGNAECTFFNSEVSNIDVNITVEGITNDGVPIVVKSDYRVEGSND